MLKISEYPCLRYQRIRWRNSPVSFFGCIGYREFFHFVWFVVGSGVLLPLSHSRLGLRPLTENLNVLNHLNITALGHPRAPPVLDHRTDQMNPLFRLLWNMVDCFIPPRIWWRPASLVSLIRWPWLQARFPVVGVLCSSTNAKIDNRTHEAEMEHVRETTEVRTRMLLCACLVMAVTPRSSRL